jgi:hypothetical protein
VRVGPGTLLMLLEWAVVELTDGLCPIILMTDLLIAFSSWRKRLLSHGETTEVAF